jgi:hypothetical protein
MTNVSPAPATRFIELTINQRPVRVPKGTSLLDACRLQMFPTRTL